jgi:hypothetical protein
MFFMMCLSAAGVVGFIFYRKREQSSTFGEVVDGVDAWVSYYPA